MEFNIVVGNTSVTNPGDYLILALYDASAPSVYVQYSVLIPPPYGGSYNVTFSGLEPIVYNAILWENSALVPGGTVQCEFSLQPTQTTTQVRADLFLTADSSTGFSSSSPTYTDASLSGWTYRIVQSETQVLQPGIDYTTTDTSFTLNTAPNIGDIYVLQFLPIVGTASAVVTTNNLFSGYTVLTASISIDNTYSGAFIELQGASSVFTVTLPAISTVGLFKSFFFNSDGGSHINVIIQCAGTDNIQFGGNTVSQITLGQGEHLELFKTGAGTAGTWSVKSVSATIKTVGEIFYSYKTFELNAIFLNGGLLSRTTYARLWAWVQGLPSGQLISDATWNSSAVIDSQTYYNYKGYFSTGDGSTTFRTPDLTNNSFLRIVNGVTRVAGSGATETIRGHSHTMHGAGAITDGVYTYYVGKTGTHVADYAKGGSTANLFGTCAAPDSVMRTGKDNGVSMSQPGETVPNNTGVYALIRT